MAPVSDTYEPKAHGLEIKIEELEGEVARLHGLISAVQADRARLRDRVLQAAAGRVVCARCIEVVEPPIINRIGGTPP